MQKTKSRGDNWQAAFGNLMFLLFAVFLSVYALSRFEVKKLKEEVEKIKAELASPVAKKTTADAGESAASSNLTSDNTEMRDQIMTSALKAFTSTKGLESSGPVESWLEVEEAPEGKLLVRIAPKVIYRPGAVAPDPNMVPLLNDLASLIRATGRSLKIEGYADGEDEEWLLREAKASAKTVGLNNLWSISTARASWIANYWVKKFDFNPERIEVAGFGASRPLPRAASNATPKSQKRIELLLERKR